MNCKQNCYVPIKRKINLNVETFERKKRRVKVRVLFKISTNKQPMLPPLGFLILQLAG